jgi:hypothetical protein
MDRRDSLKASVFFAGNLLMPSLVAGFFQSCTNIANGTTAWKPEFFSGDNALLLPELVEVILPETDTPGAKKAMVHVFIDLYVKDCYPKEQQTLFLQGLDDLGVHHSFLGLDGPARLSLLRELETKDRGKDLAEEKSFIKMLKKLTVMGYFTSQIGAEQAAEYIMTPGPFVGCVDMKPGQKVSAL